MIYTNSYFRKELRHAYLENKTGTNRRMAAALFLGLLSFALFLVLQPLQESVLADAVPEIIQPSYFSIVYIYIHLVLLFYTVYFIIYYDFLFFAEIRNNSWYLLIQMGYHPVSMILTKFMALLYSVFTNYTVGFVFTVFLTFSLKYTFIVAYLPALFITGFLDLTLMIILAMTSSLFSRTILSGRYMIFLTTIVMVILKITLGEYTLIANRVAMQNIYNLLDTRHTWYFLVALVVISVSCLLCLIQARNIAKYYTIPEAEARLSGGIKIGTIDSRTGKQKLASGGEKKRWRAKIVDTVTMALLITFICAALVFNFFIILINAATPGQEVAIRGIIPFVFKSSTMAPSIMLNDLAYFRKIDNQYPVQEGQIVLFEQDQTAFVERVISNNGRVLKVDIDNYPPMAQPGAMLKTVPRENVHGVFSGRNRWLGALILFANTIVGRILFLLIPAILLFYNRQIIHLVKKVKE